MTYIDLTQEIPITITAIRDAVLDYMLANKRKPKSILLTRPQYLAIDHIYMSEKAEPFITHFRGIPLVVDGVNLGEILDS